MIKILLSIAAIVAAAGIALAGGITASAQPSAHAPAARHLTCGKLLRADGFASLALAAKIKKVPLSEMVWAQEACTPAKYNGFWRPRFAKYINSSGGDFNVVMPPGTPLYNGVSCTGSGCPSR